MGFKNYALLMPSQPNPHTGAFSTPAFSYLDLTEDIGYRDGSELIDRYHDAVTEDAANINRDEPRLYWAGDAADTAKLLAATRFAFSDVLKAEPAFEQVIIGQGPYSAFVM